MLITRKSTYSGVEHTRDINVTREQLLLWKYGADVSVAMPHLSKDDRIFLRSGITPKEREEFWPTFKLKPKPNENNC